MRKRLATALQKHGWGVWTFCGKSRREPGQNDLGAAAVVLLPAFINGDVRAADREFCHHMV